jgi:hypothetical protein
MKNKKFNFRIERFNGIFEKEYRSIKARSKEEALRKIKKKFKGWQIFNLVECKSTEFV